MSLTGIAEDNKKNGWESIFEGVRIFQNQDDTNSRFKMYNNPK